AVAAGCGAGAPLRSAVAPPIGSRQTMCKATRRRRTSATMTTVHERLSEPITDPLTGAYSRALLAPRLAEELGRAARGDTGCALFLFDVDYFKSINDSYGHPRCAELLREVVQRVNGLIRSYDVLFRYGGDEFVLLLPETAKPDAVRVALRLVD